MLFAEISEEKPNKIKISERHYRFKELLDTIPSSRWDKDDDAWYFNLTWQTCLALRGTLKEYLEVGPNLKAWHDSEYYNKILPCYNLREQIDAEGYERLFPHQRGDVQFLSLARRALLANGLGSGKSQSAFSAVRWLHEHGADVFPVLIANPNSTKRPWAREIEEVMPGLRIVVIDGTATERKKQFAAATPGEGPCPIHDLELTPEPEPEVPVKKTRAKKIAEPVCTCGAHVVIINWESLRFHSRLKHYGGTALKKCPDHGGMDPKVKENTCEVHVKELNKIEFKTVIGDEIHRIMDPSSKVSRAFKAATGDAQIRFGLSGTPLSKSPENLFSPLNWLDPEAYPSMVKYRDYFLETAPSQWGPDTVIGIKENKKVEFFHGLDPMLRRMPKELILPFLPPVIREVREVEMGTKQKKAYVQMRDKMIAELDDELLVVKSALTKMTRSLQFSSSYADVEYKMVPVVDKKTGETKIVNKAFVTLKDPSCKLDAFMDDLDDFGEESLVVFATSKQLVMMLSERLVKKGVPHGLITGDQDTAERLTHMDNFQNGHTKLILCTISAGGTGITLTRGSTAVFLQRSWSMIENTQAEGRVHRIGSQIHDFVRIIDYVTLDTSEGLVLEAVEEKGRQLEFILRDKDRMKKFLAGEKVEVDTSEPLEDITEQIGDDGMELD